MKDLLITQHVWGQYLDYIPFFLLFQGISYPEYDSLIYAYDELSENIKLQLDIVKDTVNSSFEIREINRDDCVFSKKAMSIPQVAKCTRWVTYEEKFKEYKAVYVGDIDIMLCKEDEPIFEGHYEHCKRNGLCYSNMDRRPIQNDPHTIISFLKDVKRYGLFNAIIFVLRSPKYSYRYTGLHFVLSDEYFSFMNSLFPRYIAEIENMVRLKKSMFSIKYFNNEEFLRTMLTTSGIGALPSEDKYRPLHGLHIGWYRGGKVKKEEDYLKETYDFYLQYRKIAESETFQKLLDMSSDFIKRHFNALEMSYIQFEKDNGL